MTSTPRLRTVWLAAIGVLIYYALLGVISPRLPFASIPNGWRELWISPAVAAVSWLALLDGASAVLASVPVALLLTWARGLRPVCIGLGIGIGIGIAVALGIVAGSVAEYGKPTRFTGVVTLVVQ